MHNSKLTGIIPTEIGNLGEITHGDLSNNDLQGQIPTELGDCDELDYLFLGENAYTTGPIPETFDKLDKLKELSLKNSNRNGLIPEFIGDFDDLVLLDLDGNAFEGTLPTILGELTKLQYLLVNRNPGLNGVVPVPELNSLNSLKVFLLDDTELSGDVSDLCALMSGTTPSDGSYIIADCNGDNTKITCTTACCLCCPDSTVSGGCSQPEMNNLALDWYETYGRDVLDTIDFGINTDELKPDVQ